MTATVSPERRKEFETLFREMMKDWSATKGYRECLTKHVDGAEEGRRNYEAIKASQSKGADVTEVVLLKLLPYNDTVNNRAKDAWRPVAPAITKDLKSWFEGSKWTKPEDWPKVSAAILEFVSECVEHPERLEPACVRFSANPVTKGFQTGMLTPILNAIRPDKFALINNKSRMVMNWLLDAGYAQKLVDYPELNAMTFEAAKELESILMSVEMGALSPLDRLDVFSHWMVAVRDFFGDDAPEEEVRPTFDVLFKNAEEAAWAWSLMNRCLTAIGIQSPDDKRIAVTLREEGKRVMVRLNIGQWLCLGFRHYRGSDERELQIALLADLMPEEEGSEPFAYSGERDVCVYAIPFSHWREREAHYMKVAGESWQYIKLRFADWKGTAYRSAHTPVLAASLFDIQAWDRLRAEGLPESAATTARAIAPGVRYWKIAPGEDAWQWEEWKTGGFAAIGWEAMGDVGGMTRGQFNSRYETVSKTEGNDWTTKAVNTVWRFSHDIKPGDRIVANRGTTEVLGIGTVTGAYRFIPDIKHGHQIPVRWDEVTPRKVDQRGWKITLVELDEEEFVNIQGVTEAKGGSGMRYLYSEGFDLLEKLNRNPSKETYKKHQEELQRFLVDPFKAMIRDVAERLPAEMTDYLETRTNVFSKFLKNDWGKGGAYDFYWSAFYPKGGKRIEDQQLFVFFHTSNISFGFYYGEHGERLQDELLNISRAHPQELLAILPRRVGDHSVRYGLIDSEEISAAATAEELGCSAEAWVADMEEYGIRASVTLKREQALALTNPQLRDLIVETFKSLFPLLRVTRSGVFPSVVAPERPESTTAFVRESHPQYGLEQFSAETYLSEEELKRLRTTLRDKKQIILYGPPGTGKTYIAERLAKNLIGGTSGISELIQFHPAYAYEDFIEGIRPESVNGHLNYPLKPGRFLEFCRKAEATRDPCVLIIDEINRANLARVFGELMYLLEYRDRTINLAGGTRFKIPDNVYIIGTMNTADRSIALVDFALRRRFAFIPLQPDYGVLRRRHASVSGVHVEGLIGVLTKINDEIRDPHYQIGVSFFMGADMGSRIEQIWRHEIEPYLKEYFFNNPAKAEPFCWEKCRSSILTR